MKISCDVAKDLFPLYAEDLCSEDSKRLLQEHLQTCGDCRVQYERMKNAELFPAETQEADEQSAETCLTAYAKKIRRRRMLLRCLIPVLILHLIFAHYEEAVLLFRCSAGSSMETYFDGLIKQKCRESILFFTHAGYQGMDEDLLELLISVQFDSYRRIVGTCPDRQTAERSVQALMTYHYGGWVAFFDGIKQEEADAR